MTILVGHNGDEGLLFGDPRETNISYHTMALQQEYPSMSLSVIAYIENVLYPADYSGTYDWTSPFERYVTLVSEVSITCSE